MQQFFTLHKMVLQGRYPWDSRERDPTLIEPSAHGAIHGAALSASVSLIRYIEGAA